MPPEKDSQGINVKDVSGDVSAKNIVVNAKTAIFYGDLSPELSIKQFDKEDKNKWNNEDLIISVEDMEMIKSIIKNEEEVKKTLPLLSKYKSFFELLPKNHKGLLINAMKRMIREDRITNKILRKKSNIDEIDEDILSLLDDLENDDEFSKEFSHEFYEDYRKVYNLVRSQDVTRKILPFIKKLKDGNNNEEEIKERFYRFWYSRLENHPYAIFIDSWIDRRRLLSQIYEKINNLEKERVRIYARGITRIRITRAICKSFGEKGGYQVQEEKSFISLDDHSEFILIKS